MDDDRAIRGGVLSGFRRLWHGQCRDRDAAQVLWWAPVLSDHACEIVLVWRCLPSRNISQILTEANPLEARRLFKKDSTENDHGQD